MYSFRPFKNTDATNIVSWISTEEEFYLWSAGKFGEYPITAKTIIDGVRNSDEDTKVLWMTALNEDVPFGFLQICYPEKVMDTVKFRFAIIDSKVRGLGMGKILLKLAINYAFNSLNARKITLNVFEKNINANKTYLSVGFSNTKNYSKETFMGEEWIRNEMVLYSASSTNNADDETELEERMVASVIKNNTFLYAFQPIVFANSGKIYGYEALMRAENDGTNISPAAILSYASKHNKLYEIEKATLFNVLERYEKCLDVFEDRKLFINSIPGFQLNDKDYSEFKDRYNQFFKKILIEITEMTDLKDKELDLLLKRCADDGLGLAIDDYGTGYSNTASLLKYLPNCVKLDRLLISNINEDTKKQHFVKGMVEFAHANGFRALAEGVETAAELRTVIDIGIDLIQGYYTARPSFEIIKDIPSVIRDEIVSMNHKNQTVDTRKIYVVTENKELPLMRLSLEQYTGILVATDNLSLVGNTKYCAEMSIKIKDGCKCRLTVSDVFLESFMQLPCIELGNKSELTLVLKGENRIRKLGIFVPKDSKLIIEGDGNLALRVQGIRSYGIGSDFESNFGTIVWNATGALDILVEADEGIGIGGGKSIGNNAIDILQGTIRIEPACGHSVALGCVNDVVPIKIENTNVHLDLKTESGIGIGCGGDTQDITIANSKLNIICAGTSISAIGNNSDIETEGAINIDNSELSVLGNGQHLYLVGAKSGAVHINIKSSVVNLRGEGNEVMAIGSKDDASIIDVDHSNIGIKISSGTPKAYGAVNNNLRIIGGTQSTSINE